MYLNDWQDCIYNFKRAVRHPYRTPDQEPQSLTHERGELHARLLSEEHDELVDAIRDHDVHAIAKEAVDLIYVALGVLVECGVDADYVFEEVHDANMRKAGGPTREDGKQLKPDGWEPPDIDAAFERQRRDNW